MQRLKITPRADQKSKLESFGYLFESEQDFYWNESACYSFSKKEINEIENATNALQEICAEAVQTVIDRDWFSRLDLTFREAELAKASWDQDELSLYGRFDLTWDLKSPPKMLEYNADTPTSVFEASILQWDWLGQCQPSKDQFNSLHEKLKTRWPQVVRNKDEKVYFLCLQGNAEEITQTEYLRDVAHQAGLRTEFLFLEDLGWDDQKKLFIDLEENPVRQAFKLYPW
ncbi:MAG: glutathionylspermidine synthase family protein, partial [Pseudobdellovibrionaceae bacterium]